MTDLARILPGFPIRQYDKLLQTIEKHQLTTSDLLTFDVADLGKRTQLPLLDLKRLCNAVLDALHLDLGVSDKHSQRNDASSLRHTGADLASAWKTISTLDATLDRALGGGIPTGRITEITGESGAGKTQFLLSLLLSVQLPPPHGLGRSSLYISTEAPLSTKRLFQILQNNPLIQSLPPSDRPSTDYITSTVTSDLESQEHILNYQVPVQVARGNVGLIILDSVAANFRAEFERGNSGSSNLAARTPHLIQLGRHLLELAQQYDLAVVVANQVSDRFGSSSNPFHTPVAPRSSLQGGGMVPTQESPLASRSWGPGPPARYGAEPPSSIAGIDPEALMAVRSSMPEPVPEDGPPAPPVLKLDYQERWFSGWGDDPFGANNDKTPSLGLVWSNQIAARIALIRRPVYGRKQVAEDGESGSATLRTWRRWMKVAFAPHVAPSGPGFRGKSSGSGDGAVEFAIITGGLQAVVGEGDN